MKDHEKRRPAHTADLGLRCPKIYGVGLKTRRVEVLAEAADVPKGPPVFKLCESAIAKPYIVEDRRILGKVRQALGW